MNDSTEILDAEVLDDAPANLAPAIRRAGLSVTGRADMPAERSDEKTAEFRARARRLLAESIPASTRRAYTRDLDQYEKWCADVEDVPAYPCDADQYGLYVEYLTETVSPRTKKPLSPRSIERAMAAIRTAHGLLEMEKPATEIARVTLKAHRKKLAVAKDPAARPQKATPARPKQLKAMVGTLDRNTLRGARDACLLLLGYACACRESEIASLDFSDVRVEDDEGLYVTVYRVKVDVTSEDLPIPYATDPTLCPVRAYTRLRDKMATHGLTSGPLFISIDHTDTPAAEIGRPRRDDDGNVITDPAPSLRLDPETVAHIIKRCASRAGLNTAETRWTGHSLRRGFVAEARANGVSFETIANHGGWSPTSRDLLGYADPAKGMANSPVFLAVKDS